MLPHCRTSGDVHSPVTSAGGSRVTECGRVPSCCCGADECRRTLMLTMEASCRCSAIFSICMSSPARSPASCVRRCICQRAQHLVIVLKQSATAWHAVEISWSDRHWGKESAQMCTYWAADLQHCSADATGLLNGTDITVCVDDDGHGPSCSSFFPETWVKDN